ncbi:MAG: hypothetical protein J6U54_20310 [Clostridiales bacterium]|nr:hypothetical protein [Clostridiales bacterium]
MHIRDELQEIVEKRVADVTGVDMDNATVHQKRQVINTSSLIIHDVMVAIVKRMIGNGVKIKDIADVFGVNESTILNWKK